VTRQLAGDEDAPVEIRDAWCHDCNWPTAAQDQVDRWEWYMVDKHTWKAATGGDEFVRFLCIGCLEARLGYHLIPQDFRDLPINTEAHDGPKAYSWRTDRLKDRLKWVAGSREEVS
jgi:hypothetical protein